MRRRIGTKMKLQSDALTKVALGCSSFSLSASDPLKQLNFEMTTGEGYDTIEIVTEENDSPIDQRSRWRMEEELMEAECTLAGEVQQIESLTRKNREKIKELHELKDEMEMLQERDDFNISMLEVEHTSAKHELEHRISVLQEQLAQLNLRLERYEQATCKSEEAGIEAEDVLASMEQRTHKHAEEVHASRQELLHLAQDLESTFRTTFKDLGGYYSRKASNAMTHDQKAEMRTNRMLRDEMELHVLIVGDAALKRRYLEQSRKKEELKVEVKVLEKFGEKDKADLADLQREARINDGRLMCMKETKVRMVAAEHSLRNRLRNEGVPDLTLAEIRQLSSKEEEERRRLNKLTRVWKRRVKELTEAIFPSRSKCMMPSSSTTSKTQVASTTSDTTNTSDNTSFDGHLTSARDREVVPAQRRSCKSENHRGVERDNGCNSFLATKREPRSWRARVLRITDGWTEIDDLGCQCRGITFALSALPRENGSSPAQQAKTVGFV